MNEDGINIIEEEDSPEMEGIRVEEDGNIAVPFSTDENPSNIKVVDESDQREEDSQRERKKNRRPLAERPNHVQISALKNMLSAREVENSRLQEALEQREYALKEAQMVAAHKEQVAIINNEYALRMKQQAAQKDFEEGMDSQDNQKVAEANVRIATTAAELQNLEQLKQMQPDIYAMQQNLQEPHYYEPPINYPTQPETQYDPQEDYADQEYREEINNAVNDFLVENSHFDHRKKNYDPSLYRKFMAHGKKLASSYISQGDEDYVNSKQFLEEVSREVLGSSPKSSNSRTSTQRSGSMVAPVNRGSGSYNGGRKDFVFTRSEFEPFSKLPDIMKEKNPEKLAAMYMKTRADLERAGALGRGLSQRRRMLASTTI